MAELDSSKPVPSGRYLEREIERGRGWREIESRGEGKEGRK